MSLQISVIYANPEKPLWLKLSLTPGSTVKDAILCSGVLERFPLLDLNRYKTGIFGRFAKLDKQLQCGDRVEIYEPISPDPKQRHKAVIEDRPLASSTV
ncbi:MAG: RnfH family protein [Halopseudomonas sp.]